MVLKDEIRKRIYSGVEKIKKNITIWNSLKDEIDSQKFKEVKKTLEKEEKDANIFYISANSFLDIYK